MSKRPFFMQRFGRQHVNKYQTLLRPAWNQFHTTLPLNRHRGSKERLVLVRSGLFGQFVNILTADDMYYCFTRENLAQKVPMQTYLELKTCSRFFIAFLKSTLDFQYFEKKYHSQSLSITDIINSETVSYLNVQKAIFHATLRKTTC